MALAARKISVHAVNCGGLPGGLQSLPGPKSERTALRRVLEASGPEAERALERRVLHDQSLAAFVLAAAGEPQRGAPYQVVSLDRALAVLGPVEVRSLARATLRMAELCPGAYRDQAAARCLWRHSRAVARLCRLLAPPRGLEPESAYTAGLLHDLGLAVVEAFFPAQAHVARAAVAGGLELEQAEELAGVGHQELGIALAQELRLPPIFSEVLGCHHRLHPDLEYLEMAALVHLCDHLASEAGLRPWPGAGPQRLDPLAGSVLELHSGELARARAKLEKDTA